MNIISILIFMFISFGAAVGAKRGFTSQLISFIGWIIVLVLSFIFKSIVANILLSICPFFSFNGLSSLNILLYEGISFLILVGLFGSILTILLHISTIFEKILKMTIILGIPSKILGAIVGMIEYACFAFIVIYILSSPVVPVKLVDDSKLANIVLNNTPILSNISSKTVNVFESVKELMDKYKNTDNKSELNKEIIDVMITNNIITVNRVNQLIDNDKITGIERF